MAAESPIPAGEIVYQRLKKAILEQALKPGTRLREDTIGEQFGVSRTVVRQALARLESQSLVETQHRRGACVAEPSLVEAIQIFEMRLCLEREVIARLVKQISVIGLQTLEAHVDQEARLKGKDGPVSIRLAGEFHILLAQLSGNVILERYVSDLVMRCSLILAMYGRAHSSECAVDEHRQIIQAIRDKNTDRATRIMEHHLGAVQERADLAEPSHDNLQSVLARYAQEKNP